MKMGRPFDPYRGWESPAAFAADIDAYFAEKDAEKKLYTANGLAWWLGMSLEGLLNFPRTEFHPHVQAAMTRIAVQVEERMIKSPMHAPFWLESRQPDMWGKKEQVLEKEQRIRLLIGDDEL